MKNFYINTLFLLITFIGLFLYNSQEQKFKPLQSIKLKLLNHELLKASYQGDIEKVRRLLEKGADINIKPSLDIKTFLVLNKRNPNFEKPLLLSF